MKLPDLIFKLSTLESIPPEYYWPLKGKVNKLDVKKIVTLILEDGDRVQCGHCGSDKYKKNGRANDFQRYKCKKCGKSFNQLTGTPLAGLKKKGRWLNYSDCLSKGYSVRRSATIAGVSKKTSFKWRHRFLHNANKLFAPTLNGIVETKETSFKYSEKGAKVIRHPERFGTDVYVFSSLDRDRLTTTPIIDEFDVESILQNMQTTIAKDALYVSEGKTVIKEFSKQKKLNHVTTNSSFKEDETEFIHTKNINKYNDQLKYWMKRFRGVATKYLHNYLSWYRELDEFKMIIPNKIVLVRAKTLERFPYNPIL